jgi:membrane glycosyltransferase
MVSFDLKMKVSLKKNIIVIIVNYILNITLVALATYLIGLFPLGTLITLIIILLINQALALFKAYLSRTQDSLKFKKIFNFKNVLLLTIGTILMLAVYIVILIVLIKLSNEVVGFILSIPLLFILSSVINLNAYSYVRDYYSDLRK